MNTVVQRVLAELADLSNDELNTLGEQLQRIGRALVTEANVEQDERQDEHNGHHNGNGNGNGNGHLEDLEEETPDEQVARTVGRFGIVTEAIALIRAQELGTFTLPQFAERLGLKPPATQRWLSKLLDQGVLMYRRGHYECLQPPSLRDWVVRQEEPFSPEDAAKATKLTPMDVMAEIERLEDKGVVEAVDTSGLFRYVPPDSSLAPRTRPRRLPPEKEPPSFVEARATGMPVRVAASRKATRAQRSTAGAGGVKGFKQRDKRYEEMQAKKEEAAAARKAKAQKAPKWQSRSGKRRTAA